MAKEHLIKAANHLYREGRRVVAAQRAKGNSARRLDGFLEEVREYAHRLESSGAPLEESGWTVSLCEAMARSVNQLRAAKGLK